MLAGILALGLVALATGAGAWWVSRPDFRPADPSRMAYALPEEPSLAVMPFRNLTGNKELDWLPEALSEVIGSVLAGSPELFVVDTGATRAYAGRDVPVATVAEELGVNHVLEGSLQGSGKSLRISVRLLDALDGRVLWSKAHDAGGDDLLKVQDRVATDVLAALEQEIALGPMAEIWKRNAGDPSVYRELMKALADIRDYTPEGFASAGRRAQAVLEKAPDNVSAILFVGWAIYGRVEFGLSKDVAADLALAAEYAERANAIFETGSAHFLLGVLKGYAERHEEAARHADRIIDLNEGDAEALAGAGWIRTAGGRPEEGVALFQRAMRQYPHHPEWIPLCMGSGLLMLGRYEEVRQLAEGLLSVERRDARAHVVSLAYLAAVSVWEGKEADAKAYVRRLLVLKPDATNRFFLTAPGIFPYKDKAFLARYMAALRTAGLPDPEARPAARP